MSVLSHDAATGGPQGVPDATPEPITDAQLAARCHVFAFSPHVYDFYGDADAILAHVDAAGMDLTERRMFLLAVESAAGAELKLYEQVSAQTWSVTTWRGDELGPLRADLGTAILANKGVFCVGEQTKGVLAALGLHGTPDGVVPAPHSPRAAFGHPIRALAAGDYARATIAMLC